MRIRTKTQMPECGFFKGAFFGGLGTLVDKARDASWRGDLIQASRYLKEARFKSSFNPVPGLSSALRTADSAISKELRGLASKQRDPVSGRESRDMKLEPVQNKINRYMGEMALKCHEYRHRKKKGKK